MIITTTKQLSDFCKRVSVSPFVTLDTEFIREKTYYPILCLIQVATDDVEACIDPLSPDLDMTPLFDLLQDERVVKVFHAARQDVEIFYHLTGKIPTPLFDTQLAAMVCGYSDNVAYQQLVRDLTGVELDKSIRFTDWSRRPLTKAQIAYALHDVTYLRDVYRILTQSLHETNRMSWLAEEIAVQNDPKTYETDNDEVWKKVKTPFKKPDQLHVFARLCAWREAMAKEHNRPRRYILRDDALIELAVTQPTTPEDLNRSRNIPSGISKKLVPGLLKAIETAKNDPPETWCENWQPQKALSPRRHTLAELFRLLLSVTATELRVAPRIIATNEELTEIARGNLDVRCMTGWRKEVFGDNVIRFQEGKLSLHYNPATHMAEVLPID